MTNVPCTDPAPFPASGPLPHAGPVVVPVGARESCASLTDVADEVVCASMPEPFRAVSLWYEHMPQCSDEEVCSLLDQAWHAHAHEVRQRSGHKPV